MWDLGNQKSSGSSGNADFVEEGNIEVVLLKNEPKRCRFLTKDVDIEAIMSDRKLTREEAVEYVNSELMWEEWIMPVGIWEHTVPPIPGKRYFATIPASRDPNNPITMANEEAKQNGVEENKMLPFPLRKRFLVPAYFYDLDRVLFVKNSQEFFEDIAGYLSRMGNMSDFDLYREGKGLQTRYKAVYLGESQDKRPVEEFEVIPPNEINLEPTEEEIAKKTGLAVSGSTTPPKAESKPKADTPKKSPAKKAEPKAEESQNGDPSEFVMPFGSHKGKTLGQIMQEGNSEYLNFIRDNSAGAVQSAVVQYLDSIGGAE